MDKILIFRQLLIFRIRLATHQKLEQEVNLLISKILGKLEVNFDNQLISQETN